MAPVVLSPPSTVIRGYGLTSANVAGIYLQHAANHATPVEQAELSFDFSLLSRSQLVGEWIDPATGAVVSEAKISPGLAKLHVPPFAVDLALLVRPAQATVQ